MHWSCSQNLCENGDNSVQGRFSKATFNISKDATEGLGELSAVPCCLAPVCILLGEIPELVAASWGAEAEAEPWVLGCAWWTGGGCHLFVSVVSAAYLSDVLDLKKFNSHWVRATRRMWEPLFAGRNWGAWYVCLSNVNAKGRRVSSLSVWLGKVKRGGNVFKLNYKCWCKSY